MVINQLLIFSVVFISAYSLIAFQQHQLKKVSECCICRRRITNTEEIVICPYCQTIYHSRHLSLWLKIRKKCPICKNTLINANTSAFIVIKDSHFLNTNSISQPGVNSRPKKREIDIQTSLVYKESFILECPQCRNILGSIDIVLNQCQTCGFHMFWIESLEPKIKSLGVTNHYKRNRRKRFNRNNRRNASKISYRNIEREKERKQELFQKEIQKQSLQESQDQMLSLNLDYLSRKKLNHEPYNLLKAIEFRNERIEIRKLKDFRFECFLILLLVIATLFLSLIYYIVG